MAADASESTFSTPHPIMSQSPTFSLQGKVIIQFGGTGLLGPALIKALGEAGATVVVASRSRASLDSLVAQPRESRLTLSGLRPIIADMVMVLVYQLVHPPSTTRLWPVT